MLGPKLRTFGKIAAGQQWRHQRRRVEVCAIHGLTIVISLLRRSGTPPLAHRSFCIYNRSRRRGGCVSSLEAPS
jgi:hypothetical protein